MCKGGGEGVGWAKVLLTRYCLLCRQVGGQPGRVNRIKMVRKSIARVLTVQTAKKRGAQFKKIAKDKRKPLDARPNRSVFQHSGLEPPVCFRFPHQWPCTWPYRHTRGLASHGDDKAAHGVCRSHRDGTCNAPISIIDEICDSCPRHFARISRF
jgi:hypothetical protein